MVIRPVRQARPVGQTMTTRPTRPTRPTRRAGRPRQLVATSVAAGRRPACVAPSLAPRVTRWFCGPWDAASAGSSGGRVSASGDAECLSGRFCSATLRTGRRAGGGDVRRGDLDRTVRAGRPYRVGGTSRAGTDRAEVERRSGKPSSTGAAGCNLEDSALRRAAGARESAPAGRLAGAAEVRRRPDRSCSTRGSTRSSGAWTTRSRRRWSGLGCMSRRASTACVRSGRRSTRCRGCGPEDRGA